MNKILLRYAATAAWAFAGLLLLPGSRAEAQDVPAWQMVWSDEFNGPDGSAPDPGRWGYDVGGHGWGNEELQYHTYDRRRNARIENGCLVIEAHRETYRSGGQTWDYTSARVKTQGKFTWTYGRFEARIKLPRGQGLWPAFWMLGANYTEVGWPNCGEIDIMENIGKEPTKIHGSAHGPGYCGSNSKMRTYTLFDGTEFADRFHLFAIEWEPEIISWSVDNRLYFTLRPSSLSSAETWVFDHPFFLILNVAVGGVWPGAPDDTTVFPQQMLVDYVRVYTRTSAPAPRLRIDPCADEARVSWPAVFPQARLQRAESLGSFWRDVPIIGVIQDNQFVTGVPDGVFRLR